MALLTNNDGGQVHAEGKALESLMRLGWAVYAPPAPVEVKKTPARTARTTKK